MEKTIKIYVVDYNSGRADGAGEDGVHFARFRSKREAEAFARGKTGCYGGDAKVTEDDVPLRLARRWGCA